MLWILGFIAEICSLYYNYFRKSYLPFYSKLLHVLLFKYFCISTPMLNVNYDFTQIPLPF
jgi:hypothetical protein